MTSIKKLTILMAMTLLGASAHAQAQSQAPKNLKDEFSSLGDNQEVVDRVKRLDTQQRVRVVQNRLVNRNNRIELGAYYGMVNGGDSYVQTQNVGAALQYHLTPRWSFGIEYQKSYNSLTSEGTRIYDKAYEAQKNLDPNSPQQFVAVDFPLETKLATVSFYPIYGKLNLFDSSIAQFDLYTLLGGGQKTLSSGNTSVMVAGLGAGIWINNYVTARLEARYEKYKDMLDTENRDQNSVTALASLGIMIW
jgi:outer membrane immunogenic protein